MTERPPEHETRPYAAPPGPWSPTTVDPAPHPWAPYAPPPPPRTAGTADLAVSIVLLVVGLLAGLVASAMAFVLQVLQIGCEPGDPCSEGVQDGVAIAIAGPWLVYLPLGAVAILLMARQRASWWASTLAVLGATVVWVHGSWVAFDSATW
ncbi:hypothetical protein [Nocardioides zeae]